MRLALNVFSTNNWVQYLASFGLIMGMVWGVVWGGIRLWHKRQVVELAAKITPLLTEINGRLDSQDAVLSDVQHEVTLNNGSSVKDSVNRIEESQILTKTALEVTQAATTKTLERMAEEITTIRIDLSEHLGVHKGMLMVRDA